MLTKANDFFAWANANQGVVAMGIFTVTLFLGWASGIFSALLRKPKFRISIIPGPSYACTFGTSVKKDEYNIHRTGFALYLHITNVGSGPAAIDNISIGYKWAVKPLTYIWLKQFLFLFWINDQSVIMDDFQVAIGDKIKFYPFLVQRSPISGTSSETYLEIGRSTNGLVYFEQNDSWGACFPRSIRNNIKIKLRIMDSFGRIHNCWVSIPRVSLADARKYNPSFGLTLSTLRGQSEPIDIPTDEHGNIVPA